MIRSRKCADCKNFVAGTFPSRGLCSHFSLGVSPTHLCEHFKEKPMDEFDKRAFLIAANSMLKSEYLSDEEREMLEKEIKERFGFEVE